MPMRLRRTGKKKKEKTEKMAPCWEYSLAQEETAKRLNRVGVSLRMRFGRNTRKCQGSCGFKGGTRKAKKGFKSYDGIFYAVYEIVAYP